MDDWKTVGRISSSRNNWPLVWPWYNKRKGKSSAPKDLYRIINPCSVVLTQREFQPPGCQGPFYLLATREDGINNKYINRRLHQKSVKYLDKANASQYGLF